MTDLFGENNPLPMIPGLAYRPEFIRTDDEELLLSRIEGVVLRPLVLRGVPSKRLTAAFGVGYSFELRGTIKAPPIPDWLLPIRRKCAAFLKLSESALKEALITKYSPGASISWHRDAAPFRSIAGISLCSDAEMKLRRRDDHRKVFKMLLEKRSLYAFESEAREDWEHSIPPVEALRYSVTFRSLT